MQMASSGIKNLSNSKAVTFRPSVMLGRALHSQSEASICLLTVDAIFIIRRGSCWSMLQADIIVMAAHWDDEELKGLQADFPDMLGVYDSNASKYNPRPGVRSCMSVLSATSAFVCLTGRCSSTTAVALVQYIIVRVALQVPAEPGTCMLLPTTTLSTRKTKSILLSCNRTEGSCLVSRSFVDLVSDHYCSTAEPHTCNLSSLPLPLAVT